MIYLLILFLIIMFISVSISVVFGIEVELAVYLTIFILLAIFLSYLFSSKSKNKISNIKEEFDEDEYQKNNEFVENMIIEEENEDMGKEEKIDMSLEKDKLENMFINLFEELREGFDDDELFFKGLGTEDTINILKMNGVNFYDSPIVFQAFYDAVDKVKKKYNYYSEEDKFFKGQTLKLNIINVEEGTFENDDEGIFIKFKVNNNSKKKISLEFNNIDLITNEGEELEYDCWLRGFILQQKSILSNNFKQGAVIFYNQSLNSINNTKLIINVSDVTNGFKYELVYELKYNNRCEFITGTINNIQMKINNITLAKELKNSIERIESFEEKIGITLENISVNIDKCLFNLDVSGEIMQNSSNSIKNGFYLNIVYYNDDNEVIDSDNHWFSDFNGYDVFKFILNDSEKITRVKKIRLFVKE